MKLKIASIPTEGQSLTLSPNLPWVREMIDLALPRESPVHEKTHGTLRISRDDETLYLEGHLALVLRMPCDRCMTSFDDDLEIPIRLFLSPLHHQIKQETETFLLTDDEVLTDDEDFIFYKGPAMDLKEILREQIVLALPLRFLCKLDCRGLCATCGTNLNLKSCSCQEITPIHSRFAVLKALKPVRKK